MRQVQLEANGNTYPAAFVVPAGAPPATGFAAMVVLHDLTGYKPDTERHCHKFAESGYAALAPNLFRGNYVACVVRALTTTLRSQGSALPVIEEARRWLAARDDIDAGRIGVTGFCMGGGFALLAAADGAFAVAAPFYGSVPKARDRLLGLCPTIAQYGEKDAMFRGAAARLSRHLTELEVPHEVLVHPQVGHSFMNDHIRGPLAKLTPMAAQHDPSTEERAWGRMLAFLEDHMPNNGRP